MSGISVAIVKSDFHEGHSTSWGHEWLAACSEQEIEHELVDWRARGAFERLTYHKVVLWHFSHYSAEEMKFARPILAALSAAGCIVFPGPADSDHFDDKVAQAYLMRGLGIPSPLNYPLHSFDAVDDWIRAVATFPVVAKLRGGSGSSNVALIESADELRRYAGRMFGAGQDSHPSATYKIRSNLASARSVTDIVKRLKRAPEFLFSLRSARKLERERGYVYLQEFVPNLNHDLKVAVIGDQLSYICRSVRDGDFRASGGGGLFFDRSLITKKIIDIAFAASDQIGSECTGFDIVTDPRTKQPVILEISYGFSHAALLQAGGYFDRNHVWYPSPLNAPRALLDRMLAKARLS